MAYADDDGIDISTVPPPTPITDLGQSFKNTLPYLVEDFTEVLLGEKQPAGYYQYKYVKPNDIDQSLFRKCYDMGLGPPIKHTFNDYLWDITGSQWSGYNAEVKEVNAEDIWCSVPDYLFEVSSVILYNKNKPANVADIKKAMKRNHNQESSMHGVSNGWTFGVGSNQHVNIVWEKLDDHNDNTRQVIYYPYNRQSARDQASRLIKRAAGLYGTSKSDMAEFCNMYNIVSSGGYEFQEMPEFNSAKENTFKDLVSLIEGRYTIKVYGESVDINNVDDIVENYPSLEEGTYYDRLTCEDYGYESLTDNECNDDDIKKLINLNPTMISDGSDICRSASGIDVYRVGGALDNVDGIESINHKNNLPTSKLFCKKNHNLHPVMVDHGGAMNYKYKLEQTHNAHMAVMTWAHVHCKNSYFASFDENAEFSCLLGVNGIRMSGGAITLPTPIPGLQAGVTYKSVVKSGITILVHKKNSLCFVNKEEAHMAGPKVSLSPSDHYSKRQAAKQAAKQKEQIGKQISSVIKLKAQKAKELTKKSMSNFQKFKKKIPKKWAAKFFGNQLTKSGLKQAEDKTGMPRMAKVEYWIEEGYCDANCKMEKQYYSWNLVAGSVSFFSANARASYIRVFGASGWDRYLVQLRAMVQFVPNLVQVAMVGSSAKTAGGKALLNEIRVSAEAAVGAGDFWVYIPGVGEIESRTPSWGDYHDLNYWQERHVNMLIGSKPILPTVECYVDFENDESFIMNRFPINACPEIDNKNKPIYKGYMPVFAPTREHQIQIPWTHKKVKYGPRYLLRRDSDFSNYENGNPPDISINDENKIYRYADTDIAYKLMPNRINYAAMDLSKISELKQSYIHGLSDVLQENDKMLNPWAVTSANEANGELKILKFNFQFIQQETCEIQGLTSIFELNHKFNRFLADHLFYENHPSYGNHPFYIESSWEDEIRKTDFIEITRDEYGNIDTSATIIKKDIQYSAVRPYGLIASDIAENGKIYIRQTERNLYGKNNKGTGMLTKHLDCREDYRCICLPPTTYAYIMYSEVTHKEGDNTLIMHPIYTYEECKIAQQHEKDNFSDDMFQDLEYYMNKRYNGQGVDVVETTTLAYGCVKSNDKVVFNIHKEAIIHPDTSLVKILKFDRSLDDIFDTTNDGTNYQRFISRRDANNYNGTYIPTIVNTNLDDAINQSIAVEIDLDPKEGHDIGQVQMVYQKNTLGYFAIELNHQPLKDKRARHLIYNNHKLHTWRFVKQYLKTNKNRVEKYSMKTDDETVKAVSYLDMSHENYTYSWDPTNLPVGESSEYSFVKHFTPTLGDNIILVPEVDFLNAKKEVAFYGRNIPMKEKDSLLLNTDASIPVNGKSCDASLMLPNRCPAGYGMDGDWIDDTRDKDEYGIPYKYDSHRQCALCPVVKTCEDKCKNRFDPKCLSCLSPEGRYRCQIDITTCDRPGYIWVTTHRGGSDGRLSTHCVKTDEDPKEEDEWHTTNLQKEYWDRGEPFFPHRWQKGSTLYIRNEKSNTNYLTCNPGFVPVRATGCSDPKLTTQSDCLAKTKNTWGNCSNTIFTTESDCLAETKNTWGVIEEICIEQSLTTSEDCNDETVNIWDSDTCSNSNLSNETECLKEKVHIWDNTTKTCYNPSLTTENACLDVTIASSDGQSVPKYTWGRLKGTCSDKSFNTIEACLAEDKYEWDFYSQTCSDASLTTENDCLAEAKNVWTSTCSDPSLTTQSDCLADKKYTWTEKCSDTSLTTKNECLKEKINTWGVESSCSGYVCERCPPTYIEEDQICKKCGEREVAGHLLGNTGEDANKCQKVAVPRGHFYNSQNQAGVTVDDVKYPFVSSCDDWIKHPAGGTGAYQPDPDKLVCKTSNTTHTTYGKKAVIFQGGIVKFPSVHGFRINNERTAVEICKTHQVCNGEEIVGCKPGYIWAKQTPEDRSDEECFTCNDVSVLDKHSDSSVHGERDNFEYCDGTHMFRCADASYTDLYDLDENNALKTHNGDLFVGVRNSWSSSKLAKDEFTWNTHFNWNIYPTEEQRNTSSAFSAFKAKYWSLAPGDELAYGRSYKKENSRGIDVYTYSGTFERVEADPPFNPGAACYPVKDGQYALPNEWKNYTCGEAKDLCVHRTFHKIVPFKPKCTDAERHTMSNAVKEECYDYIYRWEDDKCTNGLLPGGCHKEYCSREGQSNCWCGEEDDFCTKGCVGGMCQEICGDRVCKSYELCYGEYNAIKSFSQCVIECQGPRSNYCLWRNDDDNTVYCRHFNTGWNSTIMQKLDPKPESPCFDEMPNIPETQCKDTFDQGCFCGRDFLEDEKMACVERTIHNLCTVLQDDNTCTYDVSLDGTCVCGDKLIDTTEGEKCYANDGNCGAHGKLLQDCHAALGNKDEVNTKCEPLGDEEDAEYCVEGSRVFYDYASISGEKSIKCEGDIRAGIKGCKDPKATIYNEYATVPAKCNYKT